MLSNVWLKIQYKVSIFRARVNYGSGAIVEKSKGEMTVRQAVQRVMSGGDIYTLHKEIAKTMAWAIGSRNPSEHNKPSETDHFHCNPFFSKPHLFYGLRNIVYK